MLRHIEFLLSCCQSYGFVSDDDTRDYLLCRLQSVCRVTEVVLQNISSALRQHHVYRYLRELHSRMVRYMQTPTVFTLIQPPQCSELACGIGCACGAVIEVRSPSQGRPRKIINLDFVEFLHNAGYTWIEIAKALMISRTTLWRRLIEANVSFGNYSDISDSDLDVIVQRYQDAHPHSGQSLLLGHLSSLGIRVQRQRVRDSMGRVDPIRTSLRWHQTISRRSYSVPAPNSLWHIDGHHSLIRWRFVVHGCVDGFSRHIMYLAAATNNCSQTVLDLFWKATREYGIPSRVRSDKGGENVKVCYFMIATQGTSRGSHIAGSSCHNQRIERMWRDVYRCVCSTYHSLFYTMEAEGLLDPDSERDIFVLHCVYLPMLQHSLQEFATAWNRHPMRTEHNWSPRKIWFNGMCDPLNSNQRGIQNVRETLTEAEF